MYSYNGWNGAALPAPSATGASQTHAKGTPRVSLRQARDWRGRGRSASPAPPRREAGDAILAEDCPLRTEMFVVRRFHTVN